MQITFSHGAAICQYVAELCGSLENSKLIKFIELNF